MATLNVQRRGKRVVMTSSFGDEQVFDFPTGKEAAAAMKRAIDGATQMLADGKVNSLTVTKQAVARGGRDEVQAS